MTIVYRAMFKSSLADWHGKLSV